MANKLLIGISAQGAIVANWRGGSIAECRTFANDDSLRSADAGFPTEGFELPVVRIFE